MLILGLNKTTLLDYPGRVAATVFVGGCNFRCPFCHNGQLVLKPSLQETYSEEEVFSFLKKRKGILKGVCITGGEPTLQADLPEFIAKIKELGYAVKLDTNGYLPNVLKGLLENKLLDYVAMDIKNCKEKYAVTAGFLPEDGFRLERIEEAMEILKTFSVDYEFRTTVVKEYHTKENIVKIGEWIAGCPHYFLQQYKENENVIRKVLSYEDGLKHELRKKEETELLHGYGRKEMEEMEAALRELPGMMGEIGIRGVD